MIPRKIHYCWFGHNPKPKLAEKCIKSWKKYCPDYEIIEWNEDNFDISSAPLYVRQAYEAKKWAFVTDYARLQIVYENGGIYLDTDVELIKNIDAFLDYSAYFGMEEERGYVGVSTGLGFGAEKGADILKKLMDDYLEIPFIDENGNYDLRPCTSRNSRVFRNIGMKINNENELMNNIAVFSTEYFCPMSYWGRKIKKTKNTYSIHWFAGTWHIDSDRRILRKTRMRDTIIRYIGEERFQKIRSIIKG